MRGGLAWGGGGGGGGGRGWSGLLGGANPDVVFSAVMSLRRDFYCARRLELAYEDQ